MMAAACSKGPSSTGCPELDAFEKLHDGRAFNGVYIAKCGIYVVRKQLVGPTELKSPHVLRTVLDKLNPRPELVVFDIDDQPAAVASGILRSLAGLRLEMARRTHGEDDRLGFDQFGITTSDQPTGGEVRLSVDLLPDRVYVGLSRVNEFQEIPDKGDDIDWEKLETTLKEHKASAFFAERTEIELAVDPALTSGTLIRAAESLSYAGFSDISILPRAKLSAQATLSPIVDVGGLQSPADIAAKLREHAGADWIEIHAGKERICDVRIAAAKEPPRSAHHVVVVHKNGSVTIAFQFRPDPKDTDPGYTSGRYEVSSPEAAGGEINNNRIGNPVKNVPLEIATEDGVSGDLLLATFKAACYARVEAIELRAPNELSIDPSKIERR